MMGGYCTKGVLCYLSPPIAWHRLLPVLNLCSDANQSSWREHSLVDGECHRSSQLTVIAQCVTIVTVAIKTFKCADTNTLFRLDPLLTDWSN